MPKNTLIAFAVFFVLLVGAGIYFTNYGAPVIGEPEEREVEGTVASVSVSSKVIAIRTADAREISLALVPETKIIDETGKEVGIGEIEPGFIIRSQAKFTGLIAIPETVRIIDSPNIIVYTPRPSQAVYAKVYLTGAARVFENNVEYRLKDDSGRILAEGFTTADGEMGEYGDFQAAFTYRKPSQDTGTLEVFETSAENGSEINKVSLPVQFGVVGG